MYFVEILIMFSAMFFAVRGYRATTERRERKRILFIGIGTILFLALFTAGNLTLSFSLGPYYEQYKLFGMPLFAAMVAYTIVLYGAFRTNVIFSEVIISALWILMFSTLLFRSIENARPVIIITLVIFAFLGMVLSKSIRKEIEQREEIQKLAGKLEKANNKLQQMDKLKSEFVSIASHQLRSPITAISGYASLLREGTYGEVTNKMREPIERIEQSARMMAISIEDYLNVSRIEAGNMKYNLTDFNVADQAEHICDDLRPEALKRGLVLLFRKRVESKAIVNADIGKVQQIIHNLINNAIKYTEKGAITVYVHEDKKTKKIYVDFLDTGIGMNTDTLHSIFQKFERGDKANTVNVKGTGLGLYVAQKMAEAMNGTITAHSEGEGQGSRFTLELPLVM
jgi:signal transduction histidine kinase